MGYLLEKIYYTDILLLIYQFVYLHNHDSSVLFYAIYTMFTNSTRRYIFLFSRIFQLLNDFFTVFDIAYSSFVSVPLSTFWTELGKFTFFARRF